MINPELDLVLLKLLTNKTLYYKYIGFIDIDSLSDEAKLIIKAYKNWYEIYNEDCDYKTFTTFFFDKLHANFLQTDREYYRHIFSRILSITQDGVESVLDGLKYRRLGKIVLSHICHDDILQGKDFNLKPFDSLKLEALLNQFNKKSLGNIEEFCTHNLKDIFLPASQQFFKSSLNNINKILGGYDKQFFHLIVGGTDAGKTSFAVNETSTILKQIGENDKILYFNNEGPDKSIRKRLVCNLLNKKNLEKHEFDNWILNNVEKAQQEYDKIVCDRIEIIGIKDKNFDYVSNLCTKYSPSLIIIDQLDNLLTSKSVNDDRSRRTYQNLYAKARQLAEEIAPVLGFTQAKGGGTYINGDGERKYVEIITKSHVFDSNVDKQANCDTFIGIGVSNSFPNKERIINIDRNKNGDLGMFHCMFKGEVSRFIDN